MCGSKISDPNCPRTSTSVRWRKRVLGQFRPFILLLHTKRQCPVNEIIFIAACSDSRGTT